MTLFNKQTVSKITDYSDNKILYKIYLTILAVNIKFKTLTDCKTQPQEQTNIIFKS